MTDHPILFSAPMVRALLDGRKTQTRRILKPQPLFKDGANPNFTGWRAERVGKRRFQIIGGMGVGAEDSVPMAIGDRLWVQEPWRTNADFENTTLTGEEPARFEADGAWETCCWGTPQKAGCLREASELPRGYSRLTLIVTDVRVQRLQEISEADAIAEGIEVDHDRKTGNILAWRDYQNRGGKCGTATGSFHSIWNATYGPDAWYQNPWVAATTFTVHHVNIDQMGDAQ